MIDLVFLATMTVQAPEPSQTLQRVKVGLTGLAAVLVLILLASALMRFVRDDRPDVAGGAKQDVVANLSDPVMANSTANEPLAEIGVAPAATSDDGATKTAP